MATKNYEKMSSKSLVALLRNEGTTDEERAAIQAVLDARDSQKTASVNQETPTVVEVEPDDEEPSEDEIKAKEAEVAARNAIVAEMKAKIGYKAQVVPFNTATWVEGVVTGVLNDLRSKNPLWIVKDLESGKIIRKAFGSDLIKIGTEKVEIIKNVHAKKGVEYTEKQIMAQLADAYQQIGKFAEVTEFGNKDGEVTKALIIGAMHERRSNRVMYRLRKEDGKIIHKVYGNGVKVLEEIDAETFAKNAEKREKAETLSNPAKRAEYIAKEIEQLNDQIAQLREKIEAKRQALAEAEAEAKAAELE